MKKRLQPAASSEPMGIVITAGVRAPIEPMVRAYVWSGWGTQPTTTEQPEHD